jgi:DNA-binding CsgD family transcriptional regulator
MFDDQLSALRLSARERQVLELVAGGLSAKQIAQGIGIAPRTVERHIENIRNKLRARNKTHMIAKAMAFGLINVGRDGVDAAPEEPVMRFEPRLAVGE